MPTKKRPDIYGVVAEFDSPEAVLAAAQQVRAAGYRRAEAYTPFAIHGLSEALGFEKTGVPMIVLTCGVFGAVVGFSMLWYANVISYPWNIGGRPPNSWPAFIPITFELGVLGAGVSALVAMLALNRLPMPYHPLFNVARFELASRDRFFICIESADERFQRETTRAFLETLDPLFVMEVPW